MRKKMFLGSIAAVVIAAAAVVSVSVSSHEENVISLANVEALNIKEDSLLLSSIADSTFFIALETTENCLIKNIDKVCCTRDFIFVFDREGNNSVLVFNNKGNYI
jgi:hypothetical protein